MKLFGRSILMLFFYLILSASASASTIPKCFPSPSACPNLQGVGYAICQNGKWHLVLTHLPETWSISSNDVDGASCSEEGAIYKRIQWYGAGANRSPLIPYCDYRVKKSDTSLDIIGTVILTSNHYIPCNPQGYSWWVDVGGIISCCANQFCSSPNLCPIQAP